MSAAYIVRPNKRTLHAIEERKRLIYPALIIPHGSIAVHVRHGDKWKESESVDDAHYMTIIKNLYDEAPRKLGLTHNIYLSTEDEEIVRSFQALYRLECVIYTCPALHRSSTFSSEYCWQNR